MQAKLGLARGTTVTTTSAAAVTAAAADNNDDNSPDESQPLLVQLHETLADDLSSSDDDDDDDANHSETVQRLKDQVKLLRQSLHSVHESMIEVEENAALKQAKMELQLEYFKKALADSKAYTMHLTRRNQSLQSLIAEGRAEDEAVTAATTTVPVSPVITTGSETSPTTTPPCAPESANSSISKPDSDATANLSDTTLNSNVSRKSVSKKERLMQRELHTERHLMKLLQERKQLSNANFELQKRVLYWQHLTKHCDTCTQRMQTWKEKRQAEKLQKEQQQAMGHVAEEVTEVGGEDDDDVKSSAVAHSPITPPMTNKSINAASLAATTRTDATRSSVVASEKRPMASPLPFSKTKPAIKTTPVASIALNASLADLQSSLGQSTKEQQTPARASTPPPFNRPVGSSSPIPRSPRTRSPPPHNKQPLRGILKTSSNNSGNASTMESTATNSSGPSQFGLLRNQNSIYISDLQNSTRNMLQGSSNNSSHTTPAPAAALSSTSTMLSNSEGSLSASRLDVTLSREQQQQQPLELSTLAEASSSNSPIEDSSGQTSTLFYESQETNDSTIPSDGSLPSLQGRSGLLLVDSSKFTASTTTATTTYNSSNMSLHSSSMMSKGSDKGESTVSSNVARSTKPESVTSNTKGGRQSEEPERLVSERIKSDSRVAAKVESHPASSKRQFGGRMSWTNRLLQRTRSADADSDDAVESASSASSKFKKKWSTKPTKGDHIEV